MATDPYTATVCHECGGSGEVEVTVGTIDKWDEVEIRECDNCAGTGWEPPEGEEEDENEEDSGPVSCPLSLRSGEVSL